GATGACGGAAPSGDRAAPGDRRDGVRLDVEIDAGRSPVRVGGRRRGRRINVAGTAVGSPGRLRDPVRVALGAGEGDGPSGPARRGGTTGTRGRGAARAHRRVARARASP